jgi:hypothetical protein
MHVQDIIRTLASIYSAEDPDRLCERFIELLGELPESERDQAIDDLLELRRRRSS